MVALSLCLVAQPSALAATDAQHALRSATIQTCSKAKGLKFDKFINVKPGIKVLARAKTFVVVRAAKSYSARSLGSFSTNNCIVVDTSHMKKGRRYEWLRVTLAGGASGFVPARDVSVFKLDTRTFGLDLSKAKNRKRVRICRLGLPYVGVRYRGSGSDLRAGVSCMTFAWHCLNAAGLGLDDSYRSIEKLAALGKPIPRKKLKPGDLVFYVSPRHPTGPVHHVAVYVGKGIVINSSGAQGTVYPMGGVRFSQIDYRIPTASYFVNINRLL